MKQRIAHIAVRKPTKEVRGTVAVFEDLYGNLWDLIQPAHNKLTLNI